MKFENSKVFNMDGALRGMRFPMKGTSASFDGDHIDANDLALATKLAKAGAIDSPSHSKFLRQILVSVDITGPIYWWSEMDTYKVGTVANSESTMHRLLKDSDSLSVTDFDIDPSLNGFFEGIIIPKLQEIAGTPLLTPSEKTQRMKQVLPTSYCQKRHWTGNYEILSNIVQQRKHHRLQEWNTDFIDWVGRLPFAKEFVFRTEVTS